MNQAKINSTMEKLYVPPMAGVTDLVFRRILRYVLADLSNQVRLSTEMISSRGLVEEQARGNNPHRMELEKEEKGRVVIQLFGHDPEVMARAALLAQEAGASAIDINMGCPVPKIVNGKDGAALMKEPCLAEQIVKEVVRAVTLPVSVKTRLGWNEQSKNILEFTQRLEGAGIQSITIHGRTRVQGYTGAADMASIAEVVPYCQIPVLANGDIDSPEKAQKALELTNAQGIAIGRGVIGNPWLLRRIVQKLNNLEQDLEPSLAEKVGILELHYKWAFERGGNSAIQPIKRHIGKYLQGFQGAAAWRKGLAESQTYHDSLEVIKALREQC